MRRGRSGECGEGQSEALPSDASDLAKEEEYASEHAADICPKVKPYPRQQKRFPAADNP